MLQVPPGGTRQFTLTLSSHDVQGFFYLAPSDWSFDFQAEQELPLVAGEDLELTVNLTVPTYLWPDQYEVDLIVRSTDEAFRGLWVTVPVTVEVLEASEQIEASLEPADVTVRQGGSADATLSLDVPAEFEGSFQLQLSGDDLSISWDPMLVLAPGINDIPVEIHAGWWGLGSQTAVLEVNSSEHGVIAQPEVPVEVQSGGSVMVRPLVDELVIHTDWMMDLPVEISSVGGFSGNIWLDILDADPYPNITGHLPEFFLSDGETIIENITVFGSPHELELDELLVFINVLNGPQWQEVMPLPVSVVMPDQADVSIIPATVSLLPGTAEHVEIMITTPDHIFGQAWLHLSAVTPGAAPALSLAISSVYLDAESNHSLPATISAGFAAEPGDYEYQLEMFDFDSGEPWGINRVYGRDS